MAFETISDYIDEIEEYLVKGYSPQATAKALGIPKKARTINRYKKEVFDINAIGNAAWLDERRKTRSERMDEGKERIVNDLELLNLMKLRSEALLDLKIGDPYETAAGEPRKISYGSAASFWEAASRMGTQAIKQGLEIAGDDPESRKADALEGWNEPELRELRAVIVASIEADETSEAESD